jgi:hypothetical protein
MGGVLAMPNAPLPRLGMTLASPVMMSGSPSPLTSASWSEYTPAATGDSMGAAKPLQVPRMTRIAFPVGVCSSATAVSCVQ